MHSWLIVIVISLTTIAIRFLPFVLFKNRTPSFVMYLGKVLPMCAMAMLVVYCLRNVSFNAPPHALPELIAVSVTVGLHLWRRSTLLSILGGTVCYMVLIQTVFS